MPAGFADAPVDAYLSEYADAVARAGGVPLHLPMLVDQAEVVASRIDALILVGGADIGDEPDRDAFEFALLGAVLAAGKPVLGICRGAQVINVALGGTLVADLPRGIGADHADLSQPRGLRRHRVTMTRGSLASRLYGETVEVNSFHHQAVDTPGEGVLVVGRADDGVAEVIEVFGRPVLGLQWHPETLDDDPCFGWLVGAARRAAQLLGSGL